ncbi:MAG: T9SS type A sorting domain-containing protein [Bacteroidales bacterium]|nr:T9SS type A sorting domain-containing protein [Bacteroidales bacterium]
MKPKLLLLFMLMSFGILQAQDTIKTLIITEARLDDVRESYVELTNMGADTINLAEFEVGIIGAWTTPWDPGGNYWMMLPEKKLAPGNSFVIASAHEWTPRQWLKDPTAYSRSLTKAEMWTVADMLLHFPESPVSDPTDSISPKYRILETWNGRDCIYVRHHVSETDSAVIDQVNGVFTNSAGQRFDTKDAYDVAGVTDATNECTLVRKFSVKKGNLDFIGAAGQDLAESEWIPIPHQLGHWEVAENLRTLFWTVGNHGNYVLDQATLVSTTIDINWTDSILTVPWGVRNDDSIMSEFNKVPGIAWHYHYAKNHEDSAFMSARTGDILTVYACGDEMQKIDFEIQVAAPTSDANIVIPKYPKNDDGFYAAVTPFCRVTDGIPGMDTIYEIPYALRVDTLFKYLEKAPQASWEIVFVDGVTRTDLKTGDKLKVTAGNSAIKEYYIKTNPYRPSHQARLSSITWPDIPEFLKGTFGWTGDTIPSFDPSAYNYIVTLPLEVEEIPALVAKAIDENAVVEVQTAVSLDGNSTHRTVTFTVTAEDDTSVRVYNVQFNKEEVSTNIQPWVGDPFISQYVFQDQWANTFLEICNPGTEPLDLSNYMFTFGSIYDPADAIQAFSQAGDWMSRYRKYIPGYKWQPQTDWEVTPAIAVQDLNVNSVVQAGDVFVMGHINGTGQSGYPWSASEECDIDFGHNPWGEHDSTIVNTALAGWEGSVRVLMFKILNDSVKSGDKPATDPDDFELIESFGDPTSTWPIIGGSQIQQINSFVRKPQYYKGTPAPSESFGTDAATSQWIMTDRNYYTNLGYGWPADILAITTGIGSHFMYEPTVGKSTIKSLYYKVSPGYSMDESIIGVVTGTTANDFLSRIIKIDEGQTLTVKNGTTGDAVTGLASILDGDTLIVLSADASNTTKYLLTVDAEGLSDDALLTSATYTITVDGGTGTVSGFDYGTKLSAIVAGVTVPEGAKMKVIDDKGAYMPFTMLNFDTLYVDVLVNDKIFFEVTAENFINKITYQLQPTATASDAFVTSSVFNVDQETSLIALVPDGITVEGFMKYIIPAPGAAIKLVDKLDLDRTEGWVVKDDKLVVTSSDGQTTKIYYLNMLGEIPQYLAYVVSDIYAVDQEGYVISGEINSATLVSAFKAGLTPSLGATFKIVDASNNEKTDGSLHAGDKVVVTSANGLVVNEYAIDVLTSVPDDIFNNISLYPNPASSKVTISGLEIGYRIQVWDIVGNMVTETIAEQDIQVISLENQPKGIYFIIVRNADNAQGHFKLILK